VGWPFFFFPFALFPLHLLFRALPVLICLPCAPSVLASPTRRAGMSILPYDLSRAYGSEGGETRRRGKSRGGECNGGRREQVGEGKRNR
jgi:hypothetical protein